MLDFEKAELAGLSISGTPAIERARAAADCVGLDGWQSFGDAGLCFLVIATTLWFVNRTLLRPLPICSDEKDAAGRSSDSA